MPYIDIRVSKQIDNNTKNKLQTEIAGIMDLIPGKNATNTTICVFDGYTMYRDCQSVEAAFVDIRLYKESSTESKRAFAEKLFVIFDNTLAIPQSRIQMNFVELPCWASNGNLF